MSFVRTGDVSIKRWNGKVPDHTMRIMLLGTTGSGKSSFIEALAGGGQRLGISGGTLESFTQKVQAFKVENIQIKWSNRDVSPIYLVDTPGFSDSKMSEAEVVKKIRAWMVENGGMYMFFYFCRITDTRISGSAWRVIKIIKTMRVVPNSLTVVATMWDMLHGEDAMKRADGHFVTLQDDIWKDKIKEGSRVVKFLNTQLSAIETITTCATWGYWRFYGFNVESNSPITPLIFAELLDRIGNAIQQRKTLQDNRTQLLHHPNHELDATFRSSLQDLDQQLNNHIHHLLALGISPRGLDVNVRTTAYQCLLDVTLASQQFVHAVEDTLAQLPTVPSNNKRKAELGASLPTARDGFIHAYKNLRIFGSAPSNFEEFIPSVSLTTWERFTLEIYVHTERWTLLLKKP
ncbi:hypothetical protein CVT24_007603 [Panaeolus cyanescens]|uniref:G domain-containing protein n=1 Tax=Panaeolus cyanescens TaxID=181874 RepID=A0A409WA08_9AGAR|nr:hypothetical protein CVT24_007603 [Panaeolus cyanescens]